VTYPGTISLSTAHLTHLSDLLRGHRAAIGSRWRKPVRPHGRMSRQRRSGRSAPVLTRIPRGYRTSIASTRSWGRCALPSVVLLTAWPGTPCPHQAISSVRNRFHLTLRCRRWLDMATGAAPKITLFRWVQ
jgi:hypothetical protein